MSRTAPCPGGIAGLESPNSVAMTCKAGVRWTCRIRSGGVTSPYSRRWAALCTHADTLLLVRSRAAGPFSLNDVAQLTASMACNLVAALTEIPRLSCQARARPEKSEL